MLRLISACLMGVLIAVAFRSSPALAQSYQYLADRANTSLSNVPLPSGRNTLGAAPGEGINIVSDYHADPTNTLNSSIAIQGSFDAAAGNPISIPSGQYKLGTEIDSSVMVDVGGIGTGAGPGPAAQSNSDVSQILLNTSTMNGFVVTSIYPSYFHDFQMNVEPAARLQSAGYGIELIGTGTSNVANATIERVGFTGGMFNPIHIVRPGWPHIEQNYFDSWASSAISCVTSGAIEGSCGFISHNNFFGDNGTYPGTQGPPIYSETGYLDAHDNEILGGTYGVQFNITNGPGAGYMKVHDNTIENFWFAGVEAQSSDGHVAADFMVQNNEFSGFVTANTVGYVVLKEYDVGGASVADKFDSIVVSGNVMRGTMQNATQPYIDIQTGKNIQVVGNLIYDIGTVHPLGIVIQGPVSQAGFAAPILVADNTFLGIPEANRYTLNSTGLTTIRDQIGMTVAHLPATGVAGGSMIWATDGAPGTAPCTGSSTGAMAFYMNGAWNCGSTVTNANLTGPIASVGNATSIASQTGTGTKFVVDTSPTLVTPNIGVASGTSLSLSSTLGVTGIGTFSTQNAFGGAVANNGLGLGGMALSNGIGINWAYSGGAYNTTTHGASITYFNNNQMYVDALDSGSQINVRVGSATNVATITSTGINAAAIGATTVSTGAFSTLAASGAVTAPGLATSSAATTGTVCWTTGTGNETVDTTLACLSSAEDLKDIAGPFTGVDALAETMRLSPIRYTWKSGTPKAADAGEHIGLGAFATGYVDERLIGRDDKGNPRGWRQDAMIALLVATVQEQQAEIETLKRISVKWPFMH
jgi:hypothetical protein